ncbi:MAG: hypothetical protein ACJAYU_004782 [Bradymonadia bacterium]|jgi:hypothetical protein
MLDSFGIWGRDSDGANLSAVHRRRSPNRPCDAGGFRRELKHGRG